MTRPSRPMLVVAVAIVVALGVGACGVPNDDAPRTIAGEAMPAELRDPVGGTSTTLDDVLNTQTQVIYLVRTGTEPEGRGQELVPIPIEVTNAAEGDQLARLVVETLLSLIPEEIGEAEVVNKIPPNTRVLDARLQSDGVLELNLSTELSQGVQSDALLLAIAQIVFTVTDINGLPIESVRVLIDGSPVAVPTEADTADAGATVSRSDYPELARRLSETDGP